MDPRVTAVDELLDNARRYADEHASIPTQTPMLAVAVLTCMDARIDPSRLLGLEPGDAHVIRNAGGRATEDALRSLAVSNSLLGTRDVIVIQHTDCEMMTEDEVLRRRLTEASGADASRVDLLCFDDVDRSLREDVARILGSPFTPDEARVYGYVFDVVTGSMSQVVPD